MFKNSWENICQSIDTCALTGAAAFFAGIPKAEILVNGPLWCYFYALRHLERTVYNIADKFHCSQPDNNAIVYGTEKILIATLERLLKEGHNPEILFIESSCALSLIGDDILGIARKVNLPFPVVVMDCGGLIGGFADGYSKAGVTFLEQIATEKVAIQPLAVNLLGLTDFYLNGAADRKEICRILEKAGYQINTVLGSSSIATLKNIAQAKLNIVCNEELGLKIAEYLYSLYGTPYVIAGLPYGIKGTKKWIQRINNELPCPYWSELIRECAEAEQRLIADNNELSSKWGNLWFDNIVVSATGTMALCLAESVRQEWVDTANLTVICKQTVHSQEYCTVADCVYTVPQDFDIFAKIFQAKDMLLLASSSESMVLRVKGKNNFVSCNIFYPTNDEALLGENPFAGIKGSSHMLQRLWNAFIKSKLDKQRQL